VKTHTPDEATPATAPAATTSGAAPATRKPLYTHLYFQVLVAIALGVAVGYAFPAAAVQLKPLGDAFIRLVKMMIAPIVFTTVVAGIARVGDLKEVGRVGVKALVYFEGVSTLALAIGLVVVNLVRPGAGINASLATLDTKSVATYVESAKSFSVVDLLLHVIPESVVGAFAAGDILQVLFFAVLLGVVLLRAGASAKRVVDAVEQLSHLFFDVIGLLMRLAPVGAFGAMAFTIGQYGLGTLLSLGKLMACVYVTCLLFVFLVLGTIARVAGFGIVRFLRYIREELLIVLGTSSSEAALPRLMAKLENVGCSRSVVGLVIPTGYSFNLDGTAIYLTMAAVFIAQATNTPLSLGKQLGILAILLLTSKGAAGVTGSGFVTLAATLSAVGTIPVEGVALLIGVDRFMSEARAITNIIGNGVATMAVARWEGALDLERARRVLASSSDALTDRPEAVAALAQDAETPLPIQPPPTFE
jgi:aerobic C4-dicarboxylate transport protein